MIIEYRKYLQNLIKLKNIAILFLAIAIIKINPFRNYHLSCKSKVNIHLNKKSSDILKIPKVNLKEIKKYYKNLLKQYSVLKLYEVDKKTYISLLPVKPIVFIIKEDTYTPIITKLTFNSTIPKRNSSRKIKKVLNLRLNVKSFIIYNKYKKIVCLEILKQKEFLNLLKNKSKISSCLEKNSCISIGKGEYICLNDIKNNYIIINIKIGDNTWEKKLHIGENILKIIYY